MSEPPGKRPRVTLVAKSETGSVGSVVITERERSRSRSPNAREPSKQSRPTANASSGSDGRLRPPPAAPAGSVRQARAASAEAGGSPGRLRPPPAASAGSTRTLALAPAASAGSNGRLRPAPATVARGQKVQVIRRRIIPAGARAANTSDGGGSSASAAAPGRSVPELPRTGAPSNALKVGVPPPPAPPTRSVQAPRARETADVSLAPRPSSGEEHACFDVGGRLFKIATKLVRSKPDTLLAKLLAKASAEEKDREQPMFVDACPDRFSLILDWYRYSELFVPRSIAVDAVLRDCARLALPSEVMVNGALRSTKPELRASKVRQSVVAGVINRWPNFQSFFAQTLSSIDEHYQAVGSKSAESSTGAADDEEAVAAEEAFDMPRYVLPLFGESGWLQEKQVCSAARARVLAVKLEELGYLCEFTDSELVVGLPMKLRGEDAGNALAGQDGDEEAPEEPAQD